MNLEMLFSITSSIAILGWILLILFSQKKITRWLVHRGTLSLILAIVYSSLLLPNFFDSPGGFSTLASVRQLFERDQLLLAGWIHYLAFDLLIGAWISREGFASGISHYLIVPCLILTFLFGPIGFLVFIAIRGIRPLSKNSAS